MCPHIFSMKGLAHAPIMIGSGPPSCGAGAGWATVCAQLPLPQLLRQQQQQQRLLAPLLLLLAQ